MGISGAFLKEFKNSRKLIKLNELEGKCIAIDVSNELYRAVTGMKNVNLLTDKDGNITSHILVMLQNALKFKKNNTRQIYVFDAKPYDEKKNTLEKRKQIKENAKTKMDKISNRLNQQNNDELIINNVETFIIDEDDEINNSEINNSEINIDDTCNFISDSFQNIKIGDKNVDIDDKNVDIDDKNVDTDDKKAVFINKDDINDFYSAEKMAFSPTKQMFDDIKFILDKLGIEWVQLDYNTCGEAEQYCAYLTKNNIADYVFTSDIDAFMFGSVNVIRREQTERKDKNGNIKKGPNAFYCYNLQDMLNEKNITYDNLIDIGIALGTDFSLPIKGIGIKTAFKKLNSIKEKFDDSHRRTYQIFTTDCNYIPTSIENNGDNTNIDELKEFLINEKNFNIDNVNKMLN